MIYAAFLRGVNVGGRTAPSARLMEVFEEAGFTDVKTVLASGNVRFDSPEKDCAKVKAAVEQALRTGLGYEVSVQLRTLDELKAIIAGNPFAGVAVTKDTRLYVSFYDAAPRGVISVPYHSDNGDLRVINQTGGEVYGVLTLTPATGTVVYMALLDREYGKTVTTRSWSTLLKLAGN